MCSVIGLVIINEPIKAGMELEELSRDRTQLSRVYISFVEGYGVSLLTASAHAALPTELLGCVSWVSLEQGDMDIVEDPK